MQIASIARNMARAASFKYQKQFAEGISQSVIYAVPHANVRTKLLATMGSRRQTQLSASCQTASSRVTSSTLMASDLQSASASRQSARGDWKRWQIYFLDLFTVRREMRYCTDAVPIVVVRRDGAASIIERVDHGHPAAHCGADQFKSNAMIARSHAGI